MGYISTLISAALDGYAIHDSNMMLFILLKFWGFFFFLFKFLDYSIRLLELISILSLQKGSVLRHMTSVIQPIMEKGIVDHSIIHRALLEYLSIADQVLCKSVHFFPVRHSVVFLFWHMILLLGSISMYLFKKICMYGLVYLYMFVGGSVDLLYPCFSESILLKSSASDVIQQLSGPFLVRMIHTRDGSKLGILCVKHGNPKVCCTWPLIF